MDDKHRSHDEQDRARKLRLKLEGWREVLLPLHSVLVWKNAHHPACIAGTVTVIFLLLWYLELSLLTTVSLMGMLACLLDYLVPLAATQLFARDKWTSQQERQLHDICLEMVRARETVLKLCAWLKRTKRERPRTYVALVLACLLAAAWTGNGVDNLLLTYLVVLTVAMMPGILRHELVHKGLATVVLAVRDAVSKEIKER